MALKVAALHAAIVSSSESPSPGEASSGGAPKLTASTSCNASITFSRALLPSLALADRAANLRDPGKYPAVPCVLVDDRQSQRLAHRFSLAQPAANTTWAAGEQQVRHQLAERPTPTSVRRPCEHVFV